MTHPLALGGASAFIALNALLMPVAFVKGWPRGVAERFQSMLVSGCEAPRGWPAEEQVFVVREAAGTRVVHTESGTFEDWELPLASRNDTIFSVGCGGAPEVARLWSPVWVRHERRFNVFNMTAGRGATPEESAEPARAYIADVAARGQDVTLLERLARDGRISAVKVAWPGVLNNALMLAAGCVYAGALCALPGYAQRRRLAMWAAGVCPRCRYEVGNMARCPECGAERGR